VLLHPPVEDMDFIDAHFHYWDVAETSPSGHSAKILGGAGKAFPQYLPSQFMVDMAKTGHHLKKAVFVEALSNNPLEETRFVFNLAKSKEANGIPHGIVAYADLSKEDVDTLLKGHSTFEGIRGIRQILNHHDSNPGLTWPKVERRDYLRSSDWRKGLSHLEKYHMSFDLQVNPHQLKDAAECFHNFPNIPVILNHLGCPHLGQSHAADAKSLKDWREGMAAIAQLKQSSVKLSMLSFVKAGWEKDVESNKLVTDLVKETIKLFGTNRCMFGSNYPVDKANGVEPDVLYRCFKTMVSDLSESAQKDLFYDTANRVYRL